MKSDLNRLMKKRDYAALLVTGGTFHNPPMYYLANGVTVGESTILVKKRGRDPVIVANAMERDEAAKSGLRVINVSQYDYRLLLEEAQGDPARATAGLLGKILADLGVKGKVAVYGYQDQGAAYRLLTAVRELAPDVEIVGEYGDTLFDRATATKDADEVKRIRAVGRKTMKVVAGTEDFLTSHRAKGGYLVKPNGSRLTIGDVKQRIRQMLMEENLVDPEDSTIFAIGRDAGVPHSRGEDRHPIALGKSIVYDIFPAEPGGGYFFDFTRTWCVGYAPPEVEQAYEDVLNTFKAVSKALKPGAPARTYQRMTCELFEAQGHPTIRTDPRTASGYVHSLGHGVGLRIHEAPHFRDFDGNGDRLDPGAVFTVEPGLYYPERGFGVRLEDTVWLNPKSKKFETLARYPKNLVLRVRGAKAPAKAAKRPKTRRRT